MTDETPQDMQPEPPLVIFCNEIDALCERYSHEADLSVIEMAGALDFKRHCLYRDTIDMAWELAGDDDD